MAFPFGAGKADNTSTLLTVGGIAALLGIGWYVYQKGLLGDIFAPANVSSLEGPQQDDGDIDEAPVVTTPPVIGGVTNPPPQPMPPGGWPLPDYAHIFNPQLLNDDGINDADIDRSDSDFWEGASAPKIDRDNNHHDDDNHDHQMSSTCKKCYDDCNRASRSKYEACKKCGTPCGFKVRLSDGRVRVTNTQSNMVLALAGRYYDGRVYDQNYVLASDDDYH